MQRKRALILVPAALIVIAVVALLFGPFIVANGLRMWAQRAARREGFDLQLNKIEAPLFRPVIIRNLRIESGPEAPFHIECVASRLELGVNLSGLFTGSRRTLRSLNVEGLTVDVRPNPASTRTRTTAWPLLDHLMADQFSFASVNLHIENGSSSIDVNDAALTASELESGIFTAREVTVASPWFHKTLSNLRGATSWQESRITLGAVSVMRGLDLDTMTIDLSRIAESNVGMEVNVDAFGGKIRARFSSEDHADKRTWDIAGNASGISLGQMSDALEWSDRASGSLHASKFTFRGEMNDLRNATAAIWAEVTGLTWRDRTADTVMIGAALYNRTIQVEQLYIKQRNNQLTLSGEFGWPEPASDWLQPAFRGDISASINDLGDFARLFGWSPSDFAGKLAADGRVDVRHGKLGGDLSVSGRSLVLFRAPIESLEIKADLEDSTLSLSRCEIRQKEDFFRASGSYALTGNRPYSATVEMSVADIAEYAGFIPSTLVPFSFQGAVAAEWKGRGSKESDSGTWHARARNLRPAGDMFLPFDAELDATYSPENLFFRQFHLWNQHADLTAFVTVAREYFHLQDLRFDLNGRPRVQGNIFLPVSVDKIRQTARWREAFGPDPFFDIDLTVEPIDLAELVAAVKTKRDVTGWMKTEVQLSGTPASLQGKSQFHLQDFVWDGSPALTADAEIRLGLGLANVKAVGVARGSDPVKMEGVLPLQLEKRDGAYALSYAGPLSLTLDFPAIFLARLPGYLTSGVFTRGIVSGNLTIGDSIQQPLITGAVNLVDGQFLRGPGLSAGVSFKGRNAVVDFLHLSEPMLPLRLSGNAPSVDLTARGEIDFADFREVSAKIFPSLTILASSPDFGPDDCVGSIEFYAAQATPSLPTRQIREVGLEGNIETGRFTLLFPSPNGIDPPAVFPLCPAPGQRGKTLLLVSPSITP